MSSNPGRVYSNKTNCKVIITVDGDAPDRSRTSRPRPRVESKPLRGCDRTREDPARSKARSQPVAMADIKDIMGIKASAKAPAAKKQKTAAEKKPDGISREAWQIMRDNQQTDALASVVPTHAGLKDKRKVSARKVSWSWQPFKNSARTDNLMLRHWVKTGTGGTLLPGSNGGDVGGDYAFSKYNKKVDMVMYNDEEYENLLQFDQDWSREETDYLFELLARFDLRFLVAHDRWEREGGKERTVEDMKDRYYAIARKLLEARADNPEEAAAHPVIKDPFNSRHEIDRKLALGDQMERTNALEREERAILDEVKAIEERRRVEARALSNRAAAAFNPYRVDQTRHSIDVDEMREEAEAEYADGTPSLPTAEGADVRPPAGVYARGVHVNTVAGEMATAAVGAGGARGVRRIETAVEELGVKPPVVSTRAVCQNWLKLREEVTEMLELRKALAKRQEELCGTTPASEAAAAAAPAAKAAAEVFQSVGLLDTPRSKAPEQVLGPDCQPICVRPAKRDNKRKMPARYEDAPPSPPRRSAEKRARKS